MSAWTLGRSLLSDDDDDDDDDDGDDDIWYTHRRMVPKPRHDDHPMTAGYVSMLYNTSMSPSVRVKHYAGCPLRRQSTRIRAHETAS